MAGEATGTMATLAGIMEQAQAEMSSQFLIQSRLFRAPGWWAPCTDAKIIQFPVYPAPSPVSESATEADIIAPSAVSIASVTATPGVFTKGATVTKLAILGGKSVPKHAQNVMVNDTVSGVDKHIAAVATEANFTATPIQDVVTLAQFQSALTVLENTGYEGQKWAFLSPYMIGQIMTDARLAMLPQTNEEFIRRGAIGELLGVPIFSVPSGWLPTATTSGKKNGWMGFTDFGIGIGYHKGDGTGEDTLLHLFMQERPHWFEIWSTAYVRAAKLSATGGVLLLSDSASL